MFIGEPLEELDVLGFVGDEYTAEGMRGFGSVMDTYSGSTFNSKQERHGSYELRRECAYNSLSSCRDDVVCVLEGGGKGMGVRLTVEVAAVELSGDGFSGGL